MQATMNLTEPLEPDPILATPRVLMEPHGPKSPGASTRAEGADRWQLLAAASAGDTVTPLRSLAGHDRSMSTPTGRRQVAHGRSTGASGPTFSARAGADRIFSWGSSCGTTGSQA